MNLYSVTKWVEQVSLIVVKVAGTKKNCFSFSKNCLGETAVTKISGSTIIQSFNFLVEFIDNSRDWLKLHKSWSKGLFYWSHWVIESVNEYIAGIKEDPWFTTGYDWHKLYW